MSEPGVVVRDSQYRALAARSGSDARPIIADGQYGWRFTKRIFSSGASSGSRKKRRRLARRASTSNASAAALGLIENLQREGLNPIEEAHGYASLIRDFDLTQETAAERVGKGRATVANSLRLLSLDADIQGFIAKNLLSVGHAKVLLGVDDTAHRALLARRVIEEGLSVRTTEKLTLAAKTRTGSPVRRARRGVPAKDAAEVAAIEKKLTSHLGARVAVLHSAKKGRIVIEYRGNEDLQRLLEKLGVEA